MVVHAAEPRPAQGLPSRCGGVSAHLVETKILNPSLDGRAKNLLQYDSSPEVDSSLERLREMIVQVGDSDVDQDLLRASMLTEIDVSISLNLSEGEDFRTIAGTAEPVAAGLKGSGRDPGRPSGRGLVRDLTGPLGVWTNPDDYEHREVVEALQATDEVIARVPVVVFQVHKKMLEKQMGGRKVRALFGRIGALA